MSPGEKACQSVENPVLFSGTIIVGLRVCLPISNFKYTHLLGGQGPLAAFLRAFVCCSIYSHHHPVWLAGRVRSVGAWVTGARRVQVGVLFGEEVVKKTCMLESISREHRW